jgi:hypothetical protein
LLDPHALQQRGGPHADTGENRPSLRVGPGQVNVFYVYMSQKKAFSGPKSMFLGPKSAS